VTSTEATNGLTCSNAPPHVGQADGEWVDMFAFDYRQASTWRAEGLAIVRDG